MKAFRLSPFTMPRCARPPGSELERVVDLRSEYDLEIAGVRQRALEVPFQSNIGIKYDAPAIVFGLVKNPDNTRSTR